MLRLDSRELAAFFVLVCCDNGSDDFLPACSLQKAGILQSLDVVRWSLCVPDDGSVSGVVRSPPAAAR